MRSRQESPSPAPAAVLAAGRAAFPGFCLRVVASTPSTQDVVRAAAQAGEPEGFCCVAHEQTAGRGRAGRSWVAPRGGALLVSILLRQDRGRVPGLTLAAGLAVADAIEAACGVRVGLRWPNDIVMEGRKVAGVLAESASLGQTPSPVVIVGIGVNLQVERLPPGVVGTSLHRFVTPAPRWDELLAPLLPRVAGRLAELDQAGIRGLLEPWRRRATGLGRPVRREGPGGTVEGTAVDIADDGALLVRTGSGELTRIIAGEVLSG